MIFPTMVLTPSSYIGTFTRVRAGQRQIENFTSVILATSPVQREIGHCCVGQARYWRGVINTLTRITFVLTMLTSAMSSREINE